jgi:hypothetical protein
MNWDDRNGQLTIVVPKSIAEYWAEILGDVSRLESNYVEVVLSVGGKSVQFVPTNIFVKYKIRSGGAKKLFTTDLDEEEENLWEFSIQGFTGNRVEEIE